MDKIDIKILQLLQENSRYPLKYLAGKVFFLLQQYLQESKDLRNKASSAVIMQKLIHLSLVITLLLSSTLH